MKLVKSPNNLQLLQEQELLQEFPLITSVVFYCSAWFRKEIRWMVLDDSSFLKPLITEMLAKDELTASDVDVLNFYEKHYQEIKNSSADARRDLMSTGSRKTSNKFGAYADSNLDEIIYKDNKNGN